jgi:hypothetical protein
MAKIDDLLAAFPPDAPASAAPSKVDGLLAAFDQKPAPVQPAMPTPDAPSFAQRFMKGLNDIPSAGAQLALHALPDGLINGVNKATDYVNHLPVIGPVTQALGMVPATAQSLDADIQSGEKSYQAGRQAGANTLSGLITGKQPSPGIDWARMGGNVLGAIPAAAAIPVAGPGLLPAAIQGAAIGPLTQPVTSGDFASGKLKQVATGAAGGAAGNLIGRGIAAAISPTVRPEVQTLLDSGVTPTPGQIIGGGTNRVEQAMTSIPVLGDMVKNAQRRAVGQLNTAAVNRSLSPIGDALPPGTTGRDAIEYASGKLGDAYDNVLSRIGAVKPDEQFIGDLSSLSGLVNGLPKAQSEQFGRILDNEILGRIDAHGVMTGEGIKAAESNLGNIARGYGRATDYDQRTLSTAVQQAQAHLREMLARQSPQNAADLSAINEGYANLMRTQRASSYVGADGGVFSPSQLQSAVKALDPSKNNRQFATGNALMQDLSEAGKSVLGPTLPDSGTPFRHAVQGGIGLLAGHTLLPGVGGAAVAPAAATAGLLAMPYTTAGQRAAAALLTQRPDFAPTLANAVRRGIPFAPLLAPALVGSSNN